MANLPPPPAPAFPAFPPAPEFVASVHIPNFLGSATPTVIVVGDSEYTPNGANSLVYTEITYSLVERYFRRWGDASGKTVTFLNFAIAGAVEAMFGLTGNQIIASGGTIIPSWFTNLNNTWASYVTAAITACAGSATVVFGFGMNGTNETVYTKANLTSVLAGTPGAGATADIVFVTNKNGSSQAAFGTSTTAGQQSFQSSSSYWRNLVRSNGAVKVFGLANCPPIGLIDVGRYYTMAVSTPPVGGVVYGGYDPDNQYLVQQVGAQSAPAITGIASFPYAFPATPGGDFDLNITFPGAASAFQGGTSIGTLTFGTDLLGTNLQILPSGSNFKVIVNTAGGSGSRGPYVGGVIGTGDVTIEITAKDNVFVVTLNGTIVVDNIEFPRAQTPGWQPLMTPNGSMTGVTMTLNSYSYGVCVPTLPFLPDSLVYPATLPSPLGGGVGKHCTSLAFATIDHAVWGAIRITGTSSRLVPGGAIITPSVGASPFSYAAPGQGVVIITGGTVTAVSLKRGGTTIVLGATTQSLMVWAGDAVIIGYSASPTVSFVPAP